MNYKIGDRVVIDNIREDRSYIRSVLDASVGQKGKVVYVNNPNGFLIVKFDRKISGFGQITYNFNEVRRA